MKRSGWIPRRTGLKPGGRIRNRSTRRMGMDDLANLQMDDLARACVMVRDGASYAVEAERLVLQWFGRCRECGPKGHGEKGLQWSHVYGRGEKTQMRWIPDNAIAHCGGCHYRYGNSLDKRGHMQRIIGEELMLQLDALSKLTKPRHDLQRIANIEWLKAHGPWALIDLEWLWEQRALRAAAKPGGKA